MGGKNALEQLEGTSATVVRRLAARLQGQLLRPGDSGYDSARRVFNAMIDRHPALIIRCASVEDVVEGVSEENQDLFWGLRGGGGNFGIATALTLQLHPVDQLLAGSVTYPVEKARAAMRFYHEFASTSPDELTTAASLSRTTDGDVAVSVAVCYAGPIAHGGRLLEPLRVLGPESDAIQPVSYQALQQASDGGFPSGQQHYWKAGWLTLLDDEVVDVMVDFVARMPSPSSGVGLQQLHGAAGRVDATTTAYPHRGSRYDCLILSQWPDAAESPRNIAWTREFFEAMQPFFAAGVYVNNPGEEGELRLRQAYGPNYDRLIAVKTKYDPTNLFQYNQNIQPRVAAE
jgi:FAD/FMN-containing dehydrogenase